MSAGRWRAVKVVLWTAGLAGLLYGADRILLGPRQLGWTEVGDIDRLPAAAGRILVPTYLPNQLMWPPSRVLSRGGESPGWWVGLRLAEGTRTALWIGVAGPPHPTALGAAALCLRDIAGGACPPGWHVLSRAAGELTLYVIGTLEPRVMARILAGLEAPEG